MPSLAYVSVLGLDCGNHGKRFNNWTRTTAAKSFLQQQSFLLNTSVSGKYNSKCLIEYERGGNTGVWIHPVVASEYQKFLDRASKISDCLYVIQMSETNFHKIGVTHDIPSRLNQLQAGNPIKLSVVLQARNKNAKNLESILHKTLKSYLVHREWFDIPFEFILKEIKLHYGLIGR